MDYVRNWELMKKQVEELKSREVLLYALNNPYFKLNINHPEIAKKWDDFQKANGLGRHTSGMDDYRKEFEEQMLNSKYFKRLEAAEAKKYCVSYEYIKLHGCWPTE